MLNLFIGPMFSGKTTMLLSRLERYKIGGKSCIVIKYDKDNRYDANMVCTHSKYNHEAVNTNLLSKMDDLVKSYDVILIDEVQFYSDAAFMCDNWANNKIVECYGLNGDYKREPFEQISLMIPLCDNITHLTAIDKNTGDEAPFTFRLTNDEEQEVIGGEDKYIALSRQSFKKYNQIMANKEY